MKQLELESLLSDYLAEMSVTTSEAQLSLLAQQLLLVLAANDRVNLTRITDVESAALLHTADSLSILCDVALAPTGALLDLGSGAGFPGVPLAICSNREVVLLDSVSKKMREVQLIVEKLALQPRVRTISGRAEALARTQAGSFSVVVARAVSELVSVLELAAPLLAVGGRCICMKGSPEASELARAESAATLLGMRLEYRREMELPQEAGHRTIVCYRKISSPTVSLPRREGLAQHAPLG